jgi:hypothetical protein
MSLIQAWNSGIYIPRVIHSSRVGHQISWVSLFDARCNENYIITYIRFVLITKECIMHDYISCFMHKMNGNNHWSRVSLVGRSTTM